MVSSLMLKCILVRSKESSGSSKMKSTFSYFVCIAGGYLFGVGCCIVFGGGIVFACCESFFLSLACGSFLVLKFLLVFFHPFLILLFGFFFHLGFSQFGHEIECVCSGDKMSECVGGEEVKLDVECVDVVDK